MADGTGEGDEMVRSKFLVVLFTPHAIATISTLRSLVYPTYLHLFVYLYLASLQVVGTGFLCFPLLSASELLLASLSRGFVTLNALHRSERNKQYASIFLHQNVSASK